jgi:predicted O-methyltransferase YrrM
MNQSLFSAHDALGRWYLPVQLTCDTVLRRARRAESIRSVIRILETLQPDDYSTYIRSYLAEGLEKFGEDWEYLDITNALLVGAALIKPSNYLEIGVRRGRSLAMVASAHPLVDIVGFDMWQQDYAGMANPGADFVASEMKAVGHMGKLELVSGDSHQTVPAYLENNPNRKFDLITVDGDHSDEGALADLEVVIPRLAIGGMLVFDDVAHPTHPNLLKVWRKALQNAPFEISSSEFTSLGYGVALGIRLS